MDWLGVIQQRCFYNKSFIASNSKIIMNYELGRILKKIVVAYFKVLSQHLSDGSKENHKRSHESRYSNLGPLNTMQSAGRNLVHCTLKMLLDELLANSYVHSYHS
jgi:hypothetical protein